MAKDLLEHRDEVVAMVRGKRTGLFFDIDGTLSRLVDTPDPAAAILSTRMRNALHTLSRTTHVVLLTGRGVTDARLIVGLDGVTYSGNHGVEWHRDGEEWVIPEAEPYIANIHEIAVGAKARVKLWANPTEVFYGEVHSIAPRAEQTSEGMIVRVLSSFPNPDHVLLPEMMGEAKIECEGRIVLLAFSRQVVRFFTVEVWSWFP